MHFIEVGFVKCRKCSVAVDAHVMNFTSLLGPRLVTCHWCGATVQTDRIEWWQMRRGAKIWFFVASLIYVILAALLGGLSSRESISLWTTGEMPRGWGLDEPVFWCGAGIWSALIVLIQVYRLKRSLARRHQSEDEPLRRVLLTLQVGGQIKVLALLLLIPAACWAGGWLLRLAG
jgi:hypothetical protein